MEQKDNRIYVAGNDERIFIQKEEFDSSSTPYRREEVSEEDFQKILVRPRCYRWHWENGKPVLKYEPDDFEKKIEKNNKICEYQSYLDSTDYVISKLNELKLEDEEEFEKAKEEYKEVLAKRKEARARINQLEE